MPILDLDINGCIKEGPWATKANTLVKLNPNHPTNKSTIQVQVVVTNALSYDVLVWGVMLYPMGFVSNFWEETTSHRPWWQLGDGHHAQLQAHILHEVLDMCVVLPYCLDLLACYLGGWDY
jgi:hypothetical protein